MTVERKAYQDPPPLSPPEGNGESPTQAELEAQAKAQARKDWGCGCLVIAGAIVLAIGALEFLVFLVSFAWNAGKAVFS